MENNENKIIKRTSKRNKAIELPAVLTKIYQPNRITNAHFPLTLIQSKIFAYVMLQLQGAITADMKSQPYNQLDIFSSPDLIKIKIPLNKISTIPSNYRHVKQSIKDLASVVVSVPYIDDEGRKMERITGLIRANIPDTANYNSTIEVEIEKKVADVLIKIDKNEDLQPIHFTSYYYETVLQAKCVYTPRLYPLISSWAKKGGFSISMNDLKEILSITDKYEEFKDFKKRVLEPVQDDIFEKAHCWYNCNVKGFKSIANDKIMLNFKVITPEFRKELDKKDDYIINMLKTSYHFTGEQMKTIEALLLNAELNRNLVIAKIGEVDDFIYKNNNDRNKEPIENRSNYMLKALMQQFGKFKN